VLTSLAQEDLDAIGIARSVDDQVAHLAGMARQAGLDGIVASPREVRRLREIVGAQMLIVTPGIRPAGADHNDQARTLTPREAIEAGSDYIVVGRPITAARDPLEAVENLLAEMDGR